MLGLCAHMLDIMSMVMLCVRMLFSVFCVEIRIHTCLDAWIHVLPCLCASFHMFTHVAMPTPGSTFLHAYVLRSRFSDAYMSRSIVLFGLRERKGE